MHVFCVAYPRSGSVGGAVFHSERCIRVRHERQIAHCRYELSSFELQLARGASGERLVA